MLEREGIPLRIVPGGETRIEAGDDESEIIARVQSGELLTLGNQGRYFLVDLLPDVYVPLDRLVSELKDRNVTAILAHPERNNVILRNPAVLASLVDGGCLLQVTSGSVLGEFGAAAQEFSERLLSEGLIHLIASDAHHLTFRKPLLSAAIARVAHIAGAALAEAISRTNPAAILAGEPIPALPLTPAP
jgi:protein-tyrosine phosphatase